jgi:glycosyltransferase involved in cell wall biosynthesis
VINVLIISPGFPQDEMDSSCIPFLQVYIKQLLNNRNIRLTVITEQYPAKPNYKWNDISVITLKKNEPDFIYKCLRRIRLLNSLKKINKKYPLDVIHHFWFTSSISSSGKFALKHHIKHLTTFAGQDVLKENKALRHLRHYTGNLVCLSDFHRLKLYENFSVSARVIELGIEEFDTACVEKNIDLLFCGWITSLKNYIQFLEIVVALNKKQLLKKVVICGGGEGLEDLKSKVRLLGLQNIVEITGEISRTQVLTYMQKSKIFVHTSQFESFGLVLIEALACDCIVLSKPVGIAYNNKDIQNCDTTEDFVKKIELLLRQKSNRLTPPKKYLMRDTVLKYLEIYTS